MSCRINSNTQGFLNFLLVGLERFRVYTPKHVMVKGRILLTDFDACQRVFILMRRAPLALAFANPESVNLTKISIPQEHKETIKNTSECTEKHPLFGVTKREAASD